MNYTDATTYLRGIATDISCPEISDNLDIIDDSESTATEKQDAMTVLDNNYWNNSSITDKLTFGQAIFTVSYTVDPSRPCPIKHGGS